MSKKNLKQRDRSLNHALPLAGIALAFVLGGCDTMQPSKPERSQTVVPLAVWIDAEKNDFWREVSKGVERALDAEGIQLEILVTGEQTKEEITHWLQQHKEDLRGVGIASDDSAAPLIDELMSEGVPAFCIGYDVPGSKRVGAAATYYYECGRKAGNDFASTIAAGVVTVISEHPVHRAQNEFWEGFRHGLLKNKRLRAQWLPVSGRSDARILYQRALTMKNLRGVFLFGAEPLDAWLETPVRSEQRLRLRVGGFSYRQEDRRLRLEQKVDWLALENPEDLGFRSGRLLYDLAYGRRAKSQVFIPFETLK